MNFERVRVRLLWCLVALVLPAFAVGSAPGPAEAAVRKAPCLIYEGVSSEMCVLWQLDASETCTIQWGTDQTYSLGSAQTSEYGTDHQHSYTISDLDPGTLCYYRVSHSAGQNVGSFRAAPPEDAVKVKFFAYGDTRSFPAAHDSVARRMVARYTADPDLHFLILSVGDLVYNGDLETDWDTQFFSALYPSIRTLLASLPYQAAMGNHERTGVGFVKYFPYPFVAGRYWSFDYGPAHFAVVVFEVSGRRVRTLVGGELVSGSHRVEWDGQDGAGRDVSPGVYLLSLRAATGSATTKIVVLD